MLKEVTVDEALALPGARLIDVRSESEYLDATIPGAVNIPLLRDDERAAVGAVYRQKGEDDARDLGRDMVSPRLPGIIREYREISREGPLVIFCWRGGMRSKSVCSVLEAAGIPVYRLIGGYKAYRRYVNEYLNRPLPHKVAVIHGLTGAGKTELLRELREMSVPAIDLEGLANNRGSVFGQIGMASQPSQKMFEALLVKELAFWESRRYIVVECESRRIGRIILPASLMGAMKAGVRILVYCPVEMRLERIKKIYGGDCGHDNKGFNGKYTGNKEQLKKAVASLGQRIGKKKVAEFCRMIEDGELDDVVRYLLVSYYDPLYRYPSRPDSGYDLNVDTTDLTAAAEKIKLFLETRMQAL